MGRFPAGERQVVGVVKNAVLEGAAHRGLRLSVNPENPDVHLVASMHDDVVTVSIDLAGRPMNQRGYRADTGTAPLRENLAAVLVMLSRYDARSEVLVDPMAGSGTIAIEAACMAQGRPVWVPPRGPAAATLPLFEKPLRRSAGQIFSDTRPLVIANELDRRTHDVSRKNIANAGVKGFVESWRGDFSRLEAKSVRTRAERRGFDPGRGVILSNPPYGERFSRGELVNLYRDLRRWCTQFHGWRAAFLVANPDFETAFGGRPRIRKPLRNGPLRGYFYLYDL
jgi:23S rRNA G2445 N2-methylase RlmL